VIDTQAKEAKDAEQRFLKATLISHLLSMKKGEEYKPEADVAPVCCVPEERLQSSEATVFKLPISPARCASSTPSSCACPRSSWRST